MSERHIDREVGPFKLTGFYLDCGTPIVYVTFGSQMATCHMPNWETITELELWQIMQGGRARLEYIWRTDRHQRMSFSEIAQALQYRKRTGWDHKVPHRHSTLEQNLGWSKRALLR